MKLTSLFLCALVVRSIAAAAVEEAVDSRFRATKPDALMGDWQGTPGYVAQVMPTDDGKYQANVFKAFDEPNAKPLAILKGDAATLAGDDWSGAIAGGHFTAAKGGGSFDLQRITRRPA